ncbi:MAG: 6-phosphogluconolactonase [Nitrospirota bacterium]
MDWRRVHFFWVDERFVPHDHADSNYRLVHDNLLRKILIPRENIHPVRTDVPSPSVSAELYEKEIKRFFHLSEGDFPEFDLVLLGMGKDGHTASLFPEHSALKETMRLAVPVYRDRDNRVTLTLPVLNNATQILFLAAGSLKTDILYEILEGENRESFPAGLVNRGQGKVTWLVDREAAKKLKK